MNRADRYRARREARLELHTRRGPIRPGDVALTLALVVVASLVLPVATTLGASTGQPGATCTTDACLAMLGTASLIGLGLPILVFSTGATVSIVRLVRHLRGWPAAAITIAAEVASIGIVWGLALAAPAL